jgi:hypothetical protein
VRPNNKVEIMAPKKLTNYVPPKGKGHSAVIFIPTLSTDKETEFIETGMETKNPQEHSNISYTLTVMEGSGSAQRISQRRPVSGTSHGLAILAICSIWLNSGLRPPCMQMILSSITAVHGRQLKVLQNVFQSLTLKRRRHSS